MPGRQCGAGLVYLIGCIYRDAQMQGIIYLVPPFTFSFEINDLHHGFSEPCTSIIVIKSDDLENMYIV